MSQEVNSQLDIMPYPGGDQNVYFANDSADFTSRFDAFESALRTSPEESGGSSTDLFAQSSDLADELSKRLRAMPETELTLPLLAVTDRLHALLPPRDEQRPDSTDKIDSAIGRIVRSYAHVLDPETLPLESLLQLARISVFCGLGGVTPQLAEAVYWRDHNELFGDAAPDFVRDTRFTSALVNQFLGPHSAADRPPAPQELMLRGREVARATDLHLMAYGFSGQEAAVITSLWGTLRQDEGGETHQTYAAFLGNLDTLQSIEREQTGLGLRLFRERRVAHFGRYPIDLLLQQFEPLPEGVQPDFMLLAHEDHNAAFSATVETLVESLGLEDLKGLRIAEVDSPEELVRLAGVLAEQFGPALSLIIGGHGEEDAVVLGPSYVGRERVQTTLHIGQVGEQLAGLLQFMLPDGTVLLISCSTGAGGAIGESVADALDKSVQAPAIPSNITRARRDGAGRIIVEFENDAGRTVLPMLGRVASSVTK